MNQTHLTDDRLIEICLAGTGTTAEPHLVACHACEGRRAALTQMLGDITSAATAEADAAFPEERLARQKARILQRIDVEGRPGRVIAFPASRPQEPVTLRRRPASRWVAGVAAAAGLVIGLLGGHLAHDLPGTARVAPAPQVVANDAPPAVALRAVSSTMSDDEFLGQVEMAIGSNGPAALRPLDVLTPRAWEVAAQ